jgi:hypothetical protein
MSEQPCPACGCMSLLRGECVLPWCPSWDGKGSEEPATGPRSAADGLGRVVGPTEGRE